MNETIASRKTWIRYVVMTLTLVVIGCVIFLSMPSGSFCSGGCAVKACRPGDTCYFKGKKYVNGLMCNQADTFVCDAGNWFDCYCHTYIIHGNSGEPDTLTCECSM
ncbi:MAG TPA: hypothetical protein PLD84_06195 [Chitinophagales bacterium]|nr:hypothetical protein [Chitinophagales bacterium]